MPTTSPSLGFNPIFKLGSWGGRDFAKHQPRRGHKNVPGRAPRLMYFSCAPSSLHINIALSFPSPSEPGEEPWKETQPRPSPRTECRRVSAPAGRLCPTPSTFPEALPGPSPLNIPLRNKRRQCKFLNRAICSARFTWAEASTKFRPYLRGDKILMVLENGMSLAPRGPMLHLGGHHAGHQGASWLEDHPGVSGTIPGHGDHPKFLFAWGPS